MVPATLVDLLLAEFPRLLVIADFVVTDGLLCAETDVTAMLQ